MVGGGRTVETLPLLFPSLCLPSLLLALRLTCITGLKKKRKDKAGMPKQWNFVCHLFGRQEMPGHDAWSGFETGGEPSWGRLGMGGRDHLREVRVPFGSWP